MPIKEADLDAGNVHTAEIDRISDNGNGIISFVDGGHANLGEMNDNMVGEVVRFEYHGRGKVTYKGKVADKGYNPVGENPIDNKNDLLGGHL